MQSQLEVRLLFQERLQLKGVSSSRENMVVNMDTLKPEESQTILAKGLVK